MKLDVKFSESKQSFDPQFGESNQTFAIEVGEVIDLSEGERKLAHDEGFAEGYANGHTEGVVQGYREGYGKGVTDGEIKGYADGLAARTYETWTITLVDGTVIEKEVALL